MEWMLMPLRRYADFQGRSRRKEYWMFVLLQVLVLFVIALLGGMTGAFANDGGGAFGSVVLGILALVYLAVFLIPNIAVQVRRFHDQDKTGWLLLLGFIPYIGGLIVFVFMLLPGTNGPNKYGPDPKGNEAETFA